MATYDDYRWHFESDDYPEGLSEEHAFTHMALYLSWLTARDLVSEEFGEGLADLRASIDALVAADAEGGDFAPIAAALLERSGGVLASEQLDADGDRFTAEYYEEVYPGDWESTIFYEEAETPYHVTPSAEHVAELFERLDEQRASWEAGEWDEEEVHEGTVRLFDLSDGDQLVGQPGELAVVSPDGLRMASADLDGIITVFEVQSGGLLGQLTGHQAPITALVFDAEGKRIASAAFDGSVRVWDAESGEELLTFEGGMEVVETLEFTPDGKRLLTIGHPLESYLDEEDIEEMLEGMGMLMPGDEIAPGLESASDLEAVDDSADGEEPPSEA